MDIVMTLLYATIGMLVILAFVLFFTIPYAKMIYNRWKLRFLEKRGALTAFIAHKNGTITEHIVSPEEEKFELKEATYILNPKKAFLLFGHRCYYYEENNPEPKEFILDERSIRFFKLNEKGQPVAELNLPIEELMRKDDGSYIGAKIIDAKTFTNLLNRAYYAGMAFAERNKNIIFWLIIGTMGVVAIAAYLNYQRTTEAISAIKAVYGIVNHTGVVIQ